MRDCRIQPTIVVAAYNRPLSLKRLLDSLSKASFKVYSNIKLIISIDYGGSSHVAKIAQEFIWEYGEKEVVLHSRNLGLKKHIIYCGSISQQCEAVIVIEDDLFVSPEFYNYSCQALSFYKDDNRIAGISLYSYLYNEYAEQRFIPINDEFDNYFIQSATSWGQMWTKRQWKDFLEWFANEEVESKQSMSANNLLIPDQVLSWPEKSWKKYFIKYIVDKDKFFVVPRKSLTTNFSDAGENYAYSTFRLQVPLQVLPQQYKFSLLSESKVIYDSHFELTSDCIKGLNSNLAGINFTTDLYGTKNLDKISTKYLLTIRDTRKASLSYGFSLVPPELNIIFEQPGSFYTLCKVGDCLKEIKLKKIKQYAATTSDIGTKKLISLIVYNTARRFIDLLKTN
jgi:hypothetical protein